MAGGREDCAAVLLQDFEPGSNVGSVFLAWLNGLQDHFIMLGGQESARSLLHLAELFRLADAAGLLRDPDDACARMCRVLAVCGVAG